VAVAVLAHEHAAVVGNVEKIVGHVHARGEQDNRIT